MNKIRNYLLSKPTIRQTVRDIGLKKNYINHMKDGGEYWNPYVNTLAKFAFAYHMTLSELILKTHDNAYTPPEDAKYDQIIAYDDFKNVKNIYSNFHIIQALNYYKKHNNVDKLVLRSDEKRIFYHFFNNYRVNMYSRTIDDICKIIIVSPYEFLRTIEAIAYMDEHENWE